MLDTPYNSLHQNDDFGLPPSNQVYGVLLTTSADTLLPVPLSSQVFKAVIRVSDSSNVFVAFNATAIAPVIGSFALTNNEVLTDANILCREVRAGDVIHFSKASLGNAYVTVAFYRIR